MVASLFKTKQQAEQHTKNRREIGEKKERRKKKINKEINFSNCQKR